jgi:hypothetical protein
MSWSNEGGQNVLNLEALLVTDLYEALIPENVPEPEPERRVLDMVLAYLLLIFMFCHRYPPFKYLAYSMR